MKLQRAREALYSYRILEHKRRERERECVGVCEREKKFERICVSITDDGQNRLSRKWNSFTGFSVFDRPFVYRSRWMAVWIWKDRLLRAQRSHIRVYVNSATSVAQLLSMKPWISIFFFYPPKRIDRSLILLVQMTSNSVQSAVYGRRCCACKDRYPRYRTDDSYVE